MHKTVCAPGVSVRARCVHVYEGLCVRKRVCARGVSVCAQRGTCARACVSSRIARLCVMSVHEWKKCVKPHAPICGVMWVDR